MSTPVFLGMPAVEREFWVPKPKDEGRWGRIICGGECRDDYARLEIYHQVPGRVAVKLQRAAMRSFREAEDKLGFKITLTGSWRSCAYQTQLYRSDPQRYADPDKTGHVRGLAIDVNTAIATVRFNAIRKALLYRGWHQSRPDDEPWHYSFGIQV